VRNRIRGHWRERLGFAPDLDALGFSPHRPRVWMHAVSFGEVRVAAAILAALRRRSPDLALLLSTSTPAGMMAARGLIEPDALFTFPLDAFGSPLRALERLRPDLLILIETELWPNLLKTARSRGVRTMLANGRISSRSAARYRWFGKLFHEVLSYLDVMAMSQQVYGDRIIALGADPSKVVVTGDVKYDREVTKQDREDLSRLGLELGLNDDRPVLVAGSTRTGEEAILLDAFTRLRKDFPSLHLILAPRHIDRTIEVERLIRSHGFSLGRRSEHPAAPLTPEHMVDVTLVDVMGELFTLYGLADVAFCGGSLVPLGGHNPLEAAAWGTPVLYGPYMETKLDAREMLEAAGAGETVTNAQDLYIKIMALLSTPDLAAERGHKGREALQSQAGASGRLAQLGLNLLALEKQPESDT
jgi:3-deoxy-D-manno-octulosonic-acid transferase